MISPKASMILNIIYFALTSLVGATWATGFVPPQYAAPVMGGLAWFAGILNFVLHAYSSPQPGPAAK